MFLGSLPKETQEHYLIAAAALINADGKIAEDEINTFNSYALEIQDIKSFEFYNEHDIQKAVDKMAALDMQSKLKIFFELLSLAYTDSDFSEEEQALINQIRDKFKLNEKTASELNDTARNIMEAFQKLAEIIN